MKVDFSRREKLFIILGLSPIIIFFFINIFISSIIGPSRECSYQSEFEKLALSGIVKKKYEDSENHNLRTIEVLSEENNLQKVLIFQNEFDEVWHQVAVSDKFRKQRNSPILTILHGTLSKTYKIDFECVKKSYWLSKFYED